MVKLNLVGNSGIFKSKKTDQIQDSSKIHKRKTPYRYLLFILFVLLITLGVYFIYFDIISPTPDSKPSSRVLPSAKPPERENTTQKTIESNATILPKDTVYEVKESQTEVRNNVLSAFIKLIDFLPENAKLQYLKVDSSRASFIFYIPIKEDGYTFETKICKGTIFHKPEVFNIKYDGLINDAPYQVTGIMSLKNISLDDIGEYELRNYKNLSNPIQDLGKSLNIDDINFYVGDNQQATLEGSGEIENCVEFFKEIESNRFNLSIKSIFLFNNVEETLRNPIVDFKVGLGFTS